MTILKSVAQLDSPKGKRVLVRMDWNEPLQNGRIMDDFRIKKSLPTLEYLKEAGARILVASHLEEENATLEPMRGYVPEGVEFLENLRKNPGERANDARFAQELASQADIYVNEAFSSSHREHASIVGVPKYLPHYAGLEFMAEIKQLAKAFHPPHPFLFILGGAKFETKLPCVEKFIDIADHIFIGGAMAKAASEMAFAKNPKIIFPVGDVSALDANEETLALLERKIAGAKFILWNGPLGNYERGFKKGTLELAQVLAKSGQEVIVGGGNTLAAIRELDILDQFSFVSTGGGAMLNFLAAGTLPGIEALKR